MVQCQAINPNKCCIFVIAPLGKIFSVIKSGHKHVFVIVAVILSWVTESCGPFYEHGLILIPAWISNYIHHKVWDAITYPFLDFNGATVEV